MKNGYSKIYFADTPLLRCPSCGYKTDSIILHGKMGHCPQCKLESHSDKFQLISEKRIVFECKQCGKRVPRTPGNMAFSKNKYICPRCQSTLISTTKASKPELLIIE